jgi:dihydroxyacetone kinase
VKKFINYVDDAIVESLSGLASAHEGLLRVEFDPTFVCRRTPKQDAVAVVSGGGSGHEPLHTGYVGLGMLDAACPGQVFTSPTPDQWMAAAHRVNAGRGVLFIVKNYAGDRLNFQMASDMLVDLDHLMVVVDDDVAIDHSTHASGRRGVAGTLIVEKMIGAAAEAGADLFDCKALGDRINSCTASMGVAFNSCIVPASGVATFEIGEHEMELGVGIHGEPGRQRMPFAPARRDRRPAARPDPQRPRAGARPRGAAARQRPGRHATDGALPAAAPCAPAADRRRAGGGAHAGGQPHDLARDGRGVADRHRARRRSQAAVGCAGAHGGAALVAAAAVPLFSI